MLGVKVRDKITGFAGIVTGVCQYISGCNQALVAPQAGDDGGWRDGQWIDCQRLERLSDDVIVLDNGPMPGADITPPKR